MAHQGNFSLFFTVYIIINIIKLTAHGIKRIFGFMYISEYFMRLVSKFIKRPYKIKRRRHNSYVFFLVYETILQVKFHFKLILNLQSKCFFPRNKLTANYYYLYI